MYSRTTFIITTVIVVLSISIGCKKKDDPYIPLPSNTPPAVLVTTPSGTQSGNVAVSYTLSDPESNTASIQVEFSINGGSAWSPATAGAGGDGTSGLTTSSTGTAHTYIWNSFADNVATAVIENDVRVRITPSDGQTGTAGSTGDFIVDNTIPNTPPTALITTPAGTQSGNITISYAISDPESDSASIQVEFSINGGSTWSPATAGVGGDGTSGLTTSSAGTAHTYVWDSVADAVAAATVEDDVQIKITPSDSQMGAADSTDNFVVNNIVANVPPTAQVATPSGTQSGDVTTTYTLTDAESDSCDIYVEYSTDGTKFYPAAQGAGGDPTTGLSTSPSGVSHSYTWNSVANFSETLQNTVYIRITPYHGMVQGTSGQTNSFVVDNGQNALPTASASTPGSPAGGNITITYFLSDAESDSISIEILYSTDGGSTFLSATPGTGGDGTTGLSSSPGSGTQHEFVWDSISDIGYTNQNDIRVQIIPSDTRTGYSGETDCFIVQNNPYEGTETPICTATSEQGHPAVCDVDGAVVYEDNRFSFLDEVFMTDISQDPPVESQITSAGTDDRRFPDVSGGRIVWVNDAVTPPKVKWRAVSGGSEQYVGSSSGNHYCPAIHGNRVVFRRGLSGVIYITIYDFSTGTDTDLSSGSADKEWPAISGDIVAWLDSRHGNYDVYMYDLSNPAQGEVRITQSSTANSGGDPVAVSGNYIAWSDTRGGIYVYDISSGSEKSLGVTGQTLAMDGIKLVYMRDYNIYLYDLNLNHEFVIVDDAYGQRWPDVNGDWVVWVEDRTGYDIYGYHIQGSGLTPNTPPSLTIQTPSGGQSGDVVINYTLIDPESEAADIVVEYTTTATWHPATRGSGGDSVTGLSTSPTGVAHTFVWDSLTDIGNVHDEYVRIRITPSDSRPGIRKSTSDFEVNNVGDRGARIINDIVPSFFNLNDSDDFFFRAGSSGGARIRYSIYGIPSFVSVKLKIYDQLSTLVRQIWLPDSNGDFLVIWDGKDEDGNWIDEYEFSAQVEIRSIISGTIEPFTSNTLQITDVSYKYRPNIKLQETEFSPPVKVDIMTTHYDLFDDLFEEYVSGGHNIPLSTLVSSYNDTRYFMDIEDAYQKNEYSVGIPAVYTIGKKYGNYILIQYWMFYPSSTLPLWSWMSIGNSAQTKSTWHEGDWEMFMVAVYMNDDPLYPYRGVAARSFGPVSATCSQHYYGQTLGWPSNITDGVEGEDFVEIEDNRTPVIYIAAGSHATYFRGRNYYTYYSKNLDETLTYNTNPQQSSITLTRWIDVVAAGTGSIDLNYELLSMPNDIMQWEGHWGAWNYRGTPIDTSDDGPRGPAYRDSDGTLLYGDAEEWHNKFIKTGQEADVTIP